MIRSSTQHKIVGVIATLATPLLYAAPVFADASGTPGVNNTINFLKAIVNIACLIAGPLCAVYLAVNGIHYMGSTGSPDRMERAKEGIKNSVIGLVIVIAALVIANGASAIANNSFGS